MKDVPVWYSPEQKFSDPTMGINIPGIEKVKGIPILLVAETNGVKSTYSLLSIDKKSKIDLKQFEIPGGYSVTTQEEFQKAVKKMNKG